MMIPDQPNLKRIKELRDVLSRYSYQYHVLDQPSTSDAIYDSLFSELKSIEADYPELITLDSPTQRVGNELIGGFKKVTHSSRMLASTMSLIGRKFKPGSSVWINYYLVHSTISLQI